MSSMTIDRIDLVDTNNRKFLLNKLEYFYQLVFEKESND